MVPRREGPLQWDDLTVDARVLVTLAKARDVSMTDLERVAAVTDAAHLRSMVEYLAQDGSATRSLLMQLVQGGMLSEDYIPELFEDGFPVRRELRSLLETGFGSPPR